MGKSTVYWDSCLFIALLKNEKRADPREMAGLYSAAAEIDNGAINLVTCAVTLTEINPTGWPRELQERFSRFTERSNVDVIPFAPAMATKAGELREYYKNEPGPNLCREDAYHLAAAITMNVSTFHTFDERDKKGCRGLIPLSGNVAGYPLLITKLGGEQGDLGLG